MPFTRSIKFDRPFKGGIEYMIAPDNIYMEFEGVPEPSKVPLSMLTADCISDLATDFRKQLFKKAGKVDPELGNH